MIEKFFSTINWVDVMFLVIISRGMYIGFKSSFFVEFLKFLGILVSAFVVLHYFQFLGKFLHEILGFGTNAAIFLAFLFLWVVVVFVFKLVRDGIFLAFKIKVKPGIDRWLGLTVATVRSLFICSMTLMLLYVSAENYLIKQASQSAVDRYVGNWAPRFYKFSFKSICGKFFPEEKINQKVFSLAKSDKRFKTD